MRNESPVHLVPCLVRLLRECLLTHSWSKVLQILDCLAYIPKGVDWIVWKVNVSVTKCIQIACFYKMSKEIFHKAFNEMHVYCD